jgi:hypothetical protein
MGRYEMPLAIDLFCGLGGWAEGFLAEGYDVIGFDIEQRPYPAQLVLQDVLTVHGSQFKDAAVIVASPPCQAYSYSAMPWKRAKALPPPDNTLFDACFRIQREACEAAGRYIPLVVENVKGAQPWVGRASWNFGSYYLWGDVPALMPFSFRIQKQQGRNFHFPEKYGRPSPSFHGADHEPSVRSALALKTIGHVNKRDGYGHTRHLTNQRESDAVKGHTITGDKYVPVSVMRTHQNCSSGSLARKAASAQIAKIPFPLAQHIARVYKP